MEQCLNHTKQWKLQCFVLIGVELILSTKINISIRGNFDAYEQSIFVKSTRKSTTAKTLFSVCIDGSVEWNAVPNSKIINIWTHTWTRTQEHEHIHRADQIFHSWNTARSVHQKLYTLRLNSSQHKTDCIINWWRWWRKYTNAHNLYSKTWKTKSIYKWMNKRNRQENDENENKCRPKQRKRPIIQIIHF